MLKTLPILKVKKKFD